MITIDILTKSGVLVKLSLEEAEEIYQALKKMFDKQMDYPVAPYYPIYPYTPYGPCLPYPLSYEVTTSDGTENKK